MKKQSFEDYLREVHAQDYRGTDDDMPDAYEAWVCDLSADDFITYADQYGELREMRATPRA